MNKEMPPCPKKRNGASKVDTFITETLSSFQRIKLPILRLRHIDKVVNVKKGKHGLPYVFLLNSVFDFFKVPFDYGVVGTRKLMLHNFG